MSSLRAATLLISTPAQWAAVASPVRLEILEFMRAIGPASVAELARSTDRPADGLYHHVRTLLRAGLLRQVGLQRTGRQSEAVYDLAAQTLRFDFDPVTGRNMDRYRKVARTVLRMTERLVGSALHRAGLRLDGPSKDLWCRIEAGWVSPADLAQLNHHLTAVNEILERGRTVREGRLVYWTCVLVPALRRRSADWRLRRSSANHLHRAGDNDSRPEAGPPRSIRRASSTAPDGAGAVRPDRSAGAAGGGAPHAEPPRSRSGPEDRRAEPSGV